MLKSLSFQCCEPLCTKQKNTVVLFLHCWFRLTVGIMMVVVVVLIELAEIERQLRNQAGQANRGLQCHFSESTFVGNSFPLPPSRTTLLK